jgi:hypothetical protein
VGLYQSLQDADAAPTGPLQAAVTAALADTDALPGRWPRLAAATR